MRTDRRILGTAAVAAALLLASPAAAVQVGIGAASGMAGQTVDVNITTSNLTGLNVRSFQFEVTYNANLITATDVIEAGTLVGSAGWGDAIFNVTANGSTGRIAVSHASANPLSGSGTLVQLRFLVNPAQLGASSSAMTMATFTFNEGTPLDTTSNATFTINATPIITVSPNTGEVIRGQSLNFTVSGSVTNPVTWATTNAGVATMSGSLLTGVAPGAVRVFAVDNAGRRDTTDGLVQIRGMGLTAGTASVVVGQSASIPLTVTTLSGLDIRSGQITLTFNGNALTATGVTTPPGTLLNGYGPVFFGSTPTSCTVDFAGSSDLGGAGVLCYVAFQTKTAGGHSLTPSVALFNETLPARVTNGSVTVSGLPTITVNPDNVTLFTGQTQQFTLSGSPTPPVAWSTLDGTVAIINSSGLLTAMGGGVTRVRAADNVGATDENTAVTVYDFRASLPTIQAPPGVTVRMPILVDRDVSGFDIRSLQYRLTYSATHVTAARALPSGLISVWGPTGVVSNQAPGQLTVAEAGSDPVGSGNSELQVLELDLSPSVPVGTNIPISLVNFLCNEGRPVPQVVNGVIQVRTSTATGEAGPVAFALHPPSPNPSAGSCRLRLAIPRGGGHASLAVFGVDGRRVRTLFAGPADAGERDAVWDGRDESGALADAGLYFVRLEWNGRQIARKLARIN